MNIRWIASRRKDELQSLAKEFGLGETGTVEDLRSRITVFIARPGHPEAVQARLDELTTHFGNIPSPRDHRNPATSPGPGSRTKMEDSKEGPKLRLIIPELPSTSQGSTQGYRETATETPAAQDEQPQRAAQGPLQGTRPEASSKHHEPGPTTTGPLATPSHQTTAEGEQPRFPQGHRFSRPGGGDISYSLLADKLQIGIYFRRPRGPTSVYRKVLGASGIILLVAPSSCREPSPVSLQNTTSLNTNETPLPTRKRNRATPRSMAQQLERYRDHPGRLGHPDVGPAPKAHRRPMTYDNDLGMAQRHRPSEHDEEVQAGRAQQEPLRRPRRRKHPGQGASKTRRARTRRPRPEREIIPASDNDSASSDEVQLLGEDDTTPLRIRDSSLDEALPRRLRNIALQGEDEPPRRELGLEDGPVSPIPRDDGDEEVARILGGQENPNGPIPDTSWDDGWHARLQEWDAQEEAAAPERKKNRDWQPLNYAPMEKPESPKGGQRPVIGLEEAEAGVLLSAFEEMPELNVLPEEQAWPIAPVAWRISTPYRRIPQSLLEGASAQANAARHGRSRIRSLEYHDGKRFRVSISGNLVRISPRPTPK
ncbi:GL22963 [Drosophila persimilis]|uniref:GL22963 n=1 Tax=Drosophila persimilis TaxID=7234 RepID=B4HDF6_DROPE|nr:GL22963 [Drosophila persimilis]